jgi:phosphatidylglycerol:prolipoprotein diacylglycerol transferase
VLFRSLIFPQVKEVVKGKPASFSELFWTGIVSFVIGFKLAGMVTGYSEFARNPQQYLFSGHGNVFVGLILAAIIVFFTYRGKKKARLEKPETVNVTVHPYQLTGNIVLVAAIFGIIGSKIFDVAEHTGELVRDPIRVLFSFSGLAFYGGFIVAAFAVSIYAERNKISWPIIADIVAPALILAYGIGRIGCQASGDGCWGIVNLHPKPGWLSFLPDWAWAFNYPHNVVDEGVLIPNCTAEHCYILGQPVFPTPLYETTLAFIIFIILWSMRKRISIPGILFAVYLILNGIERFFIEKVRINLRYDILGLHWSQAEIIAFLLMILGVAGIFYFRWKNKKRLQMFDKT